MRSVNEEHQLQEALRRLAETSPREPRPAAEERLIAAFRTRRGRAAFAIGPAKRKAWFYSGTAAASLALGLIWFASRRKTQMKTAPAPILYFGESAGFVSLPYGQSDVPIEQAEVVRMRLRSPSGDVNADVLIAQDGVARAVRLVE